VASVLRAHVKWHFLAPSKKGAYGAANTHIPTTSSLETIYGKADILQSIRVLTLALELPGALDHIRTLVKGHGVYVSKGHRARNS